MDASNWISLAFGIASLGSLAVGYGVLKQKVDSQAEALKAAEVARMADNAKNDARFTLWERAHDNTSQQMNGLQVDVAVLKERSGTQMATLERIERYVSPDGRPAPRSRATSK